MDGYWVIHSPLMLCYDDMLWKTSEAHSTPLALCKRKTSEAHSTPLALWNVMLCMLCKRKTSEAHSTPLALGDVRTNGDNTILYVIKCDVLHFMKACEVKVKLFNVNNKMNNNIPKKCGTKSNDNNNKIKNKIPKKGGINIMFLLFTHWAF